MIIWIVRTLIDLYSFVIFVSVILSWIQVDRGHPAVRFIDRLTAPVLEPVRRVLPPMAGFDLSPMVVLLGLRLLARLI